MIKSIQIDNFKSLVDFKLELSHFTCLVGLNGSGKSTVLQAMDFIAQLMKGSTTQWLEQRQWSATDLTSKLADSRLITIKLVIQKDKDCELTWVAFFDIDSLRCIEERIVQRTHEKKLDVLLVKNDRFFSSSKESRDGALTDNSATPIIFEYQGSVLSSLKDTQLSEGALFVKRIISNIQSLELLSPEKMRAKVRNPSGPLGIKGEKLAHFIDASGKSGKSKLKQELETAYQQLSKINTAQTSEGWIDLSITESFDGAEITSSAQHINDGMLRLMAVFSFIRYHADKSSCLLFDEIENGINPELVEFLVDHLVKAKSQIMVTTHSPMILNFMEEDVARAGVIYLYKNNSGHTKAIRLFDIPSLNEKLDFMGPGEAFVDTDLTHLQEEITANNEGA